MPTRSSVARFERTAVVLLVALAAAWLACHWSASPWVALVGALVILFSHAWLLFIEFALLAFVASQDSTPRAATWQLIRSWFREAVMAARVFGWRQPFRWNEIADRTARDSHGRRGVVFVHGFACNRGFWTPWMRELRSRNRCFVAVNLEPALASIDRYVPIVAIAVEQVIAATGLAPLIVCHSMGGLAARAWFQQASASAAYRIVTIGTPHHGTWLARHSSTRNGKQMRLGSEWLRELDESESQAGHGRSSFTCWYSNCDNIVMPPSTAMLAGADNRFVAGVAHVELAFDPVVIANTLALLDEADALM